MQCRATTSELKPQRKTSGIGYKYNYQVVVECRKSMGQTPRSSLQDKGSSAINELISTKEHCVDSGVLPQHGAPVQPHANGVEPHDVAMNEANDENVVLEGPPPEEEHRAAIAMVLTSAPGDAPSQQPPRRE